ncbi:hypothetical protein D3C87_1917520 [compost metagenome]
MASPVLTTLPNPLNVTVVASVVPSDRLADTRTPPPLSPLGRPRTIMGDAVVEGESAHLLTGELTLTTQPALVEDSAQLLSSAPGLACDTR